MLFLNDYKITTSTSTMNFCKIFTAKARVDVNKYNYCNLNLLSLLLHVVLFLDLIKVTFVVKSCYIINYILTS